MYIIRIKNIGIIEINYSKRNCGRYLNVLKAYSNN